METVATGGRDARGIDALPEAIEERSMLPGAFEQRRDRVERGPIRDASRFANELVQARLDLLHHLGLRRAAAESSEGDAGVAHGVFQVTDRRQGATQRLDAAGLRLRQGGGRCEARGELLDGERELDERRVGAVHPVERTLRPHGQHADQPRQLALEQQGGGAGIPEGLGREVARRARRFARPVGKQALEQAMAPAEHRRERQRRQEIREQEHQRELEPHVGRHRAHAGPHERNARGFEQVEREHQHPAGQTEEILHAHEAQRSAVQPERQDRAQRDRAKVGAVDEQRCVAQREQAVAGERDDEHRRARVRLEQRGRRDPGDEQRQGMPQAGREHLPEPRRRRERRDAVAHRLQAEEDEPHPEQDAGAGVRLGAFQHPPRDP